jgi:hypothetical protein
MAEGGIAVGEPLLVDLCEQAAERGGGRRVVGAGNPDPARLAGDRVGSPVDVHAVGTAGQQFNVAPGGCSHAGTVTRHGDIRSTSRSTLSNDDARFTGSHLGAALGNRTPDLRITSASLFRLS